MTKKSGGKREELREEACSLKENVKAKGTPLIPRKGSS